MINKITFLFQSLFEKNQYIFLLNVLFFVVLFMFVYFVVKYEQQHNKFEYIKSKIQDNWREQERLRQEKYEKQIELDGEFIDKNRLRRTSKKLIDTGLKSKYPEMTAEIFLIAQGTLMLSAGLIVWLVSGSFIIGVIAVAVTRVLITAWIEFKISRNNSQVEVEMVKFMNILENVSHSSGNIAEMLGTTIQYLNEPLRSSIEKCYYEMTSTGNISLALQHLCDRTSYKELKELFNSFKICSTHNEDYTEIIKENREIIKEHIKFRHQKNGIKKSSLIDMVIMAAAGIVVVTLLSIMIPNAFTYIFHELIGQVFLCIIVLIFLYGIWMVIKDS